MIDNKTTLGQRVRQSPIGKAGAFTYVRKITEATVQAELYLRLRQHGFSVQLEVPFRTKGTRTRLRADVGVYCPKTRALFALVEAKKKRGRPKKTDGLKIFEAQAHKYELTKLPWVYCCGWQELNQTVSWVLAQYRARNEAVPSYVGFMGPAKATPSDLRQSVEEETCHQLTTT